MIRKVGALGQDSKYFPPYGPPRPQRSGMSLLSVPQPSHLCSRFTETLGDPGALELGCVGRPALPTSLGRRGPFCAARLVTATDSVSRSGHGGAWVSSVRLLLRELCHISEGRGTLPSLVRNHLCHWGLPALLLDFGPSWPAGGPQLRVPLLPALQPARLGCGQGLPAPPR